MLVKRLKTRHLNMIALGGSIGTGIFLASGYAISVAGPGGALAAYLLIAIMVFFLITSLGELSVHSPSTGTFCKYSSDYVHPSFGYAMSVTYWFGWAITIAAEISAAVIIMKFWFPQVMDVVFAAIFFVLIFAVNLLSVRIFGEIEYVMSAVKVLVIIVFILLACIIIYGTPKHIITHNLLLGDAPFHKGFYGFFMVFLVAGFSFQGSELIGIASGEAQDPTNSIPKAVKQIFCRLLIFYLFTTLIIGLLIPFNDPRMITQNSVHTSPFTLIFAHYISGTAATNFINFVILVAILSAANASTYTASRMLWYMGAVHQAPKIFAKITLNGCPINAVIGSAIVGSSVLIFSFIGNGTLFTKLVNISSICGFIAWFGIALSHYRFRYYFVENPASLKYRALYFPFGPIFSILLIFIIIAGQGYELVNHFSLSEFCDVFGAVIFFILLMLWHKFFVMPQTTH